MFKPFSIRDALQGSITDFVSDSGFSAISAVNLVADIISLVCSYREEDVPLFPVVYILKDLDSLSTLAPGSPRFGLGRCPMSSGGPVILKSAATLADNGWSIYVILKDEKEAEFGVFRSHRHSVALSADEAMMDSELSVIRVRQSAHLSAELRNAKDETHQVSLTAAKHSVSELESTLAQIVEEMVKDVASENYPSLSDFKRSMTNVLASAVRKGHGTLLLVMSPDAAGDLKPTDVTVFDPPINVLEAHDEAVRESSADALSALQGIEYLIEGMINADGIVVFNTSGCIWGFRAFLSPNPEEKAQIPENGGGRRRTFELMRRRVQAGRYRAAMMRSQDGHIDLERVSHVG